MEGKYLHERPTLYDVDFNVVIDLMECIFHQILGTSPKPACRRYVVITGVHHTLIFTLLSETIFMKISSEERFSASKSMEWTGCRYIERLGFEVT